MSMIFQDPTAALNPVFTIGQQLGDVIKYSRPGDGRLAAQGTCVGAALDALKEVALADPERLLRQLPDPAERRHAPARLHRHGAGDPAGAA